MNKRIRVNSIYLSILQNAMRGKLDRAERQIRIIFITFLQRARIICIAVIVAIAVSGVLYLSVTKTVQYHFRTVQLINIECMM